MKNNRHFYRWLCFAGVALCFGCTSIAPPPQRLAPFEQAHASSMLEDSAQAASAQLALSQDRLSSGIEHSLGPIAGVQSVTEPTDPLAMKTVSLSMQNARVGQLLWPLSTEFGVSLSIDPQVLEMTQVSNLHLQKVNGRQALNHILSTFDVSGVLGPDNVLVVSMMEERTFDIEMLSGKTSLNVGVGGDVFGSSGKDSGVKDSLSLVGDFGDKADGIDHLVKSRSMCSCPTPPSSASIGTC
ncbi:MAG: hypothetical protein EON92_15225 [Burkholderiales bacterium]|nr:MAG: hypothetical protein EON92_15225 [Burkholderiales bacterium]